MARAQIAGVIIERQGKILMIRRNFEPGLGKLDWIGGFVDVEETPEDAALREAKEETGCDVSITGKLGSFDYFERQEKTIHMFIGRITGGRLEESVEGRLAWVDPRKLNPEKDTSFSQHKQVLDAYKACS